MADPLLSDAEIAAILARPKRSRSDQKEIEEHSIGDLIKAVEFAENRNRTRKLFTVRNLSPPGTQ